MNKLYAFCALVFLTACGSPDLDGSWIGVSERVEGYRMEISGDEAILTDDDEVVLCSVSEGENTSKLICSDDGKTVVIDLSVDGDIMTATPVSRSDRAATFVRN